MVKVNNFQVFPNGALFVSTDILFRGGMKRISFSLPFLLCKYLHTTLDTSGNDNSLTGSIDALLGIPAACGCSQVVSLSREFVWNTLHWPWNHIAHYFPFPLHFPWTSTIYKEAGLNTSNASLPDSSVTWIHTVLPTWCPAVPSPCWHRAAPSGLLPVSIHGQSWDAMAGIWGSELPQAAEGTPQTLTWLHPALTGWIELHCAWAFLVPAHPVKQCLCFVFPQEDACQCLCGMEQRLLHPCSGSSPRPAMAVNCTLLLLPVLYGLDHTATPLPLRWLGLSRGAERIP